MARSRGGCSLTNVTPRAAYAEAVQPDSSLGTRISHDEFAKIRDAFNQNTHWINIGGYSLGDTTQKTRNEFLRYLADQNPALAQTLQRGGDWGMYFSLRNEQVGDKYATARARSDVLASVDGRRRDLTAADIPPNLRQRISELGARAHSAANTVDPGNLRAFAGFLNGEWQTDEGRQIEKELRALGFREPRSVASEIIGQSR